MRGQGSGGGLLTANTGEHLKRPCAAEFPFEVMSSTLFSQLNDFSEAPLAILMSGTNVTSKMDGQVGAERKRKVGGHMHPGIHMHMHMHTNTWTMRENHDD